MESEEREALDDAIRAGWLGMGGLVGDFEQAVEKVLGGTRIAVAVNTGYSALHLGLIVAGVGAGDEVIVPSFTHLADVQAIRAVGANPVLCDILDATLCLDPARVAQLIGPRTRAILSMDYGCHLADHAEIAALAEEHGLRVVHDAAHSFGSYLGDTAIGSFSDICMFSFDPVKALSCIDAGVVVVKTEAEAQRLRALRVLGASHPAELAYSQQRSWDFDVVEDGFRYHLSNVHAAVGIAQLAKLDRIRTSREDACRRYGDRLAGIPGLRLPTGDLADLNPFLFYVRVPAGRRHAFREHLADAGVDTGIHWLPVHRTTLYNECRRGDLTVTDVVADEIVSLPLHSGMPEEVVDRVCNAVLAFFS
jgi:dTDP-4-amino-4,6-dideoxygalactose transaminase